MLEIDPSLILKYDDHIYYHGEKYQKVVEPKSFYDKLWEELTEREFLDKYTRLLPDMIVHLLREKSLTIWQQHLHFNRS